MKNFFLLTLLLFIVWFALTMSTDLSSLLTGAAVSVIISALSTAGHPFCRDIRLTPVAFVNAVLYVFVFAVELLKANLDVARRVISPSLPVHPGIVAVRTKLTSRTGRFVLANSITLTPGTLTVETDGDTFYIHWIDVTTGNREEATRQIVEKFEKYLEVIYG